MDVIMKTKILIIIFVIIIAISWLMLFSVQKKENEDAYLYTVNIQTKVCVEAVPGMTHQSCEDMFKAMFLKGYLQTHDKIPSNFEAYADNLSLRKKKDQK